MVTGGEVNYGIWSDAQFDSLVEQAINELEPDKQAELTAQAEQIFLDNACLLYTSPECRNQIPIPHRLCAAI